MDNVNQFMNNSEINAAQNLILAPIDAPKDVLVTLEQDNSINTSWTGPTVPNGPIQVSLFELLE